MNKSGLFILLSIVTVFFVFSTFIFTGCKGCEVEDIDKKVQEVKEEVVANTSKEAEEDTSEEEAIMGETEEEITAKEEVVEEEIGRLIII